MYTFDRETKSIISPQGERLKGKAVTDRLNEMHSALIAVAEIWSGLHLVMAAMDNLFVGSDDGNLDGEDNEPASQESDSSGGNV